MDRFRHLPALAQPALRRLALLLQSEKARKVQLYIRYALRSRSRRVNVPSAVFADRSVASRHKLTPYAVVRSEGLRVLGYALWTLRVSLYAQDTQVQVAALQCLMLAGRPSGCSEGTTVHTTNSTTANSSTSTPHINNISSSNSSGTNSSGVFGGLDVYTAVERLRGLGGGDTARTVLHAMQTHTSDAALQAMACWTLVNLALVKQQK
eukprot:14688-Heterococcus_DN1.PRE.1